MKFLEMLLKHHLKVLLNLNIFWPFNHQVNASSATVKGIFLNYPRQCQTNNALLLSLLASVLLSTPAFLTLLLSTYSPWGLLDSCQHHFNAYVESRHWSIDQFSLICWHNLEAVPLLKNKRRKTTPASQLECFHISIWKHSQLWSKMKKT